MKLRQYTKRDCVSLVNLFKQTVHTVNAKDYNKDQLNAWAPPKVDLDAWHEGFATSNTLVAHINGQIVGFGSIYYNGCLDKLYVHCEFQGQGIAKELLNALEHSIQTNITCFTTYSSITARGFFETQGYSVQKENKVMRSGVVLSNYKMTKECLLQKDFKEELLINLDKLHTTILGKERIAKNLQLQADNVVFWCKQKAMLPNADIKKLGKNWYITVDNCILTINSSTFSIITAHKLENK